MDPYHVAFIGAGLAILCVAWLPLFLSEIPLSLPMVAVAIGVAVGWLLGAEDLPLRQGVSQRVTEFVLIIAVMGAGLKIDRPFSWARWQSTWRLLVIVMPLSIAAITSLGWSLLHLSLGLAVLLGGILAPTDPVLASEVQVGPPGSGDEDEVRFALTSEAGLNDGAAFPFVTLGLLLLAGEGSPLALLQNWVLIDVLWKLLAGAAIGAALGWFLVRVNRWLPKRYRLSRSGDGLASIGLMFLAYALAETAQSYGFVAVFVTAVAIRNTGRAIEYAQQLHDFAEQIERLAMFLVLFLFGGAIAGGVLAALSWTDAAFAILALLVVRPVACMIAFVASRETRLTRLAIGYFGIRGIGSLYYMTFAESHAAIGSPDRLWAIVGLTVLLSIVIYGASANPVIRRLDSHCRLHRRRPEARAAVR